MSRKERNQRQLIKLLEENPLYTAKELATKIDVGLSTVHRYLSELNMTLYKRGGDPHKEHLETLYNSGLPLSVIQDELNLSKAMLYYYKNKYSIPNRKAVEPTPTSIEEMRVLLTVCYAQLNKNGKLKCSIRKNTDGIVINTLTPTTACFDMRQSVKFVLSSIVNVIEGTQLNGAEDIIRRMPYMYYDIVTYRNSVFITNDDSHITIAQAIYTEGYDEGLFMPLSSMLNTARSILFKELSIEEQYDNIV